MTETGRMLYLKGVVTLLLDQETCIGCGMCLTVCPQEVFAMGHGKKVRISEQDACMMNCPAGASWVQSGVGCPTRYSIPCWAAAAKPVARWRENRAVAPAAESYFMRAG